MATEQDYIQQTASNDPAVTEAVLQAIKNSPSAALSDPLLTCYEKDRLIKFRQIHGGGAANGQDR
ncbi:hypothetical protein, partial [Geothermobacter hydrogeniphilus]